MEDADKLSSSLFHFPTIGWKDILLYILPTIAVSLAVVNHLVGLFPKSWSHGVNAGAIQILLLALGLTFTILFLILYPLSAALSFLDKRRFFMFPEYRALRFFDRLKKRFEAFLGRAIEETIYEKENQLFHSLGMGKEPEPPIDIYLFSAILIGLISMLEFVVLLTLNQFWLVIVFIPFFFLLGRRAM